MPPGNRNRLCYPPQSDIYEASLHAVTKIAAYIFEQGLAGIATPGDVGALVRSRVYRPVYPE